MHFGGLLSFAVGGTLLLLALIDIDYTVAYNGSTFSLSNPLIPEITILGFVGFLLVGYGLFANMKSARAETKPN